MPSPTSSTRPTSRVSSCWRYSLISCVRTDTISSVLNLAMTAPLDQLLANVLQPRPHRGVVQPVADAHHHAAQQRRIDARRQHRLLVVLLPQLLAQPLALVVRQRRRAGHHHAQAAGALVVKLLDRLADATQEVEALVVV